jgi:predicted Ser/Thr protein kinase
LARHPRYRVLRELGRGGMGVVYHAEQTMMDRQVAIKVISAALLASPDALERFRREVRAAARLVHPNIVVAYDAEQAGDLHMLVMEFVEGLSLAEVLRRKGQLPIAHACLYTRQTALGLQHAFEHGMVHRDIKPQNLMLTPKGQVKILDFGLAKLASERDNSHGLTAAHAYMGTPEYSAPEQARDARSAGIQADIYSLGCTLYCLLAGRPPFQGGSAVQTILAHMEEAPPPLPELRPDVPAGLWAIVQRMLAKDPAQRYQKPAEVAQALAPFCKVRSKMAVPVGVPVAPPLPEQATPRPRDTGPLPIARRTPLPATAPLTPAPAPRKHGTLGWLLSGLAAVVAVVGLGAGLLGGLYFVRPPAAAVRVTVDPPDADVFVDGDKKPLTDAGELRLELPEGPHEVKVEKEGFDTFTRQVTLASGKTESVEVRLAEAARHPAGFERLFNGKDLAGWSVHGGGTKPWKVDEGAIVSGGMQSYLYYVKHPDFQDFDLYAEVKINDGGNSGLFFRATYQTGLPQGYEAQINATARDQNRTGSLYLHRKNGGSFAVPPTHAVKVPPNEWFRYEVSVRGNHMTLKVNGTEVLDYTDQVKHFPNGHLALQQLDRDTEVRCRVFDVKEFKELPPPRAGGRR